MTAQLTLQNGNVLTPQSFVLPDATEPINLLLRTFDYMDRPALLVIPACLMLLAGCSKQQKLELPPSSPSPNIGIASTKSVPEIDACSALTSDEIRFVQDDIVTGTTPSSGILNGFPSTQCVFQTTTPANSVSVVVTQSTPSRPVRDFWKSTFHREGNEKDGRNEREEEEGEQKALPQRVTELGEDAFWMGTQVSTALYVLKGDCYIRISVGGAGDQAAKLEKSKTLASFALARLQ